MKSLYSGLIGLLGMGYLAVSGFGCSSKASSGKDVCNIDGGCSSEMLCSNNYCECYTDNDCPGEQYCENFQCVSPIITTTTPQEIFDQMVSSMETGNLETVIDCCLDPDYKEMYLKKMAGKDLVQMAYQLKGKTLIPPSSGSLEDGKKIIQYNLDLGDKEYSPIFVKKQDGTWRIRAM